ncbi:Ferric/cupric reductase transmembrane component B [Exophiala dermatitidis]
MRGFTPILLSLLYLAAPIAAGHGGKPDGFQNAAPHWDDYCFYVIYSELTGYTWEDSSSSSTDSSSSGHGSSGSSSNSTGTSSGHGSSSSNNSTSNYSGHGSDDTGAQSSVAVASHPSSAATATGASHGSHTHAARADSAAHGSGHTGGHAGGSHGGHGGSSSAGQCNSTLEVTALYANAKALCTKKQLKATPSYWKSLCAASSYTLMDLTSIEANVTDAYIAALPVINPDVNSTDTTSLSSVVLLDKEWFRLAYKTKFEHDYAFQYDKDYGWGLMGYWGLILSLGMFAKAWNLLSEYRWNRKIKAGLATARGPNAISHFFKTYFVVPATFAPFISNHQRLWYLHSIPKRLDSIIVGGFWILCIITSCTSYVSFSGNTSSMTIANMNWQYMSDRTGILSYACLPFLYLFGGRNNIFVWLTPFKYHSFSMFHRHVAWAATILAILHSIGYTVLYTVYSTSYKSSLESNYFYMGIVATIVMSLMLFQSITWLRRKGYETFLIIHIVFAILTIYSLFRHTNFQGNPWDPYLWPMVATWSFDRGVRLGRLVYCNLRARSGVAFGARSTVTYYEQGDVLRIETYSSSLVSPGGGQYYYIYQPYKLRGWEHHPFTLASYDVPKISSAPAVTEEVKTAIQTTTVAVGANEDHQKGDNKLVFLVRPYDGWTKRLKNECIKAGGKITPRLLLEGPYGHHSPLHTFDTVVMLAGGTGISACIPYMHEHAERVATGKTKTTKIHLHWVVRQIEFFDKVAANELRAALSRTDVEIDIYCSQAGATIVDHDADAIISAEEISDSEKASQNPDRAVVRFSPGRPDINNIVDQSARDAQAASSRLAVLTCGPPGMADDCRNAVYTVMKKGFRNIEYYEDAFGW